MKNKNREQKSTVLLIYLGHCLNLHSYFSQKGRALIFCLFFFLLLFYSQYQYLTNKKKLWTFLIILSTVLAPFTFSLGVITLVFAFLFEWLCIPKELKKANGSTMFIVFLSWALSLLPYIFAAGKILYTSHYQHVGATSSFDAMNIYGGAKLLILYFFQTLIPQLLPGPFLSIGLFLFAVSSGIKYRNNIAWKKILFFFISSLSFIFIIFVFRVAWNPAQVSVSRYDVFPSLMLCMIYALLIHPFLKNKELFIKDPKHLYVIYFLAFFLISYSGMIRYNRAKWISFETRLTMQAFNIDFRSSTTNYFKDNPHQLHLTIKNTWFNMPRLPSLKTRKGFSHDIGNYTRPISYYAKYVLPTDVRNKITFEESTDQSFLDYLKDSRHRNAYTKFVSLVQ